MILRDGCRSGIVGCDRQLYAAPELPEECVKVASSAPDVLGWVVGITHPKRRGGSWHELH